MKGQIVSAFRPAVHRRAGRELGQLDVSPGYSSASAGLPTTRQLRAKSVRLWIVDALTSAERAIAARRLAAARPAVAALAGVAAPEAFWELCRDELSGVDVAAGGWDIRARWFGVVVCATPRLGELGRALVLLSVD